LSLSRGIWAAAGARPDGATGRFAQTASPVSARLLAGRQPRWRSQKEQPSLPPPLRLARPPTTAA